MFHYLSGSRCVQCIIASTSARCISRLISMADSNKTSRRVFLSGDPRAVIAQHIADGPSESDAAGQADDYLFRMSRRAMACDFELLLNAGQYPQAAEAAFKALDLIDELESQLTVYRETSEVSRINQTAKKSPIAVEPRLYALLKEAAKIHAPSSWTPRRGVPTMCPTPSGPPHFGELTRRTLAAYSPPVLRRFLLVALAGLCSLPLFAADPTSTPPPPPPAPTSTIYAAEDATALNLFEENPVVIRRMVDRVVRAATGQNDSVKAWRSLVAPTDRVGIKVSAAGGRYFASHRSIVEAILDLVRAARPGARPDLEGKIAWGPGPRASQALMLAVRARALLDGRFAPSVEDVAALAEPVLKHRMALTFAARAEGDTVEAIIQRLVRTVA